jgi:hypothetical protein
MCEALGLIFSTRRRDGGKDSEKEVRGGRKGRKDGKKEGRNQD